MENQETTIYALLQESGLRATSQRKTILEVVRDHNGPLTDPTGSSLVNRISPSR